MLSTSQTQARKPVKFAVSALTMAIFLVTFIASPAQADDLEIYQPAVTGGGKTLILMLDAAGQMNSGGNLDKVVAGLQNLLKTDDPAINTVAIGLGHYNIKHDSGGSNTSGDIVVPAATLGTLASSLPNSSGVPTTGQRKTLWDMVIAGSGNGSSQVAAVQDPAIPGHTFTFAGNGPASPVQGYAEAAAYLMGTTTAPTINSGFSASISTSKTGTHYNSPLSNTGACGGTGLYFLTSGQFVSTNAAESDVIFNAALTPVGGVTPTSVSSCAMGGYAATPGLAAVNNAPWNCMASFAQQLYDPSKNPAGAQIKTAFVGFGSNFASLGDSAAINTCHIGSKLKGDLCSPDAATAANRNPTGGYGNGGFYAVNSPADVTTSVKNFILTLGGNTVTPLVTGAASIPIDTLNPNGFQSYGYLRMIAPNPGQPATMLWKGDLKKYALSGGALVSNGSTTNFVLNTVGQLNTNTTDNWNAVAANDVAAGTGDGGIIDQGGAYPKVPMPYGVVTNATTTPPTQDLTYQNKIRPLFTDVGAVTPALPYLVSTSGTTNTTTGITHDFTDTLSSVSSNALLTPVKPKDSSGTLATNLIDTIPQMFDSTNTTISSGSPLKSLSIVQKKKLINYLGFPLPIYGADDAPLVATRYGTCTGGATLIVP
jgi:type IV pilus assembly protein PilY1